MAATCGLIYRWAGGDAERHSHIAAELVALAPDVILAVRRRPWQRCQAGDPHGADRVRDPSRPGRAGFVDSLARPGGNATGFTPSNTASSGKWLELLKEIVPRLTRAAVIRDPASAAGDRPVRRNSIRGTVARDGVAPGRRARRRRDRARRHGFRALSEWRPDRDRELVCGIHRDLIVALAARHKLPAVYFNRFFVSGGGLISYGADLVDQYRRAAGYVDRILKGEKPADLPVQQPTKYELVINLKTAKALGLEVPPTLLARADEVIE